MNNTDVTLYVRVRRGLFYSWGCGVTRKGRYVDPALFLHEPLHLMGALPKSIFSLKNLGIFPKKQPTHKQFDRIMLCSYCSSVYFPAAKGLDAD